MSLEELRDRQIAKGTPYATDEGVRMNGYAREGARLANKGYFDVPLISKVVDVPFGDPNDLPDGIGELWQGGCIGGIRLPEDFDYVLSLYPWEKYILGPGTDRDEVEMYDSADQGFEQVAELAEKVAARLLQGEKVLVHCQAGLNRSGLLAARTLIELGRPAGDAIALLRKNRSPVVLCNAAFEAHLVGLEA